MSEYAKILNEVDERNFLFLMPMGPVPGLQGRLHLNIQQGESNQAKLQSMDSISSLSTHCISALLKKINRKEHSEHERERRNFPDSAKTEV